MGLQAAEEQKCAAPSRARISVASQGRFQEECGNQIEGSLEIRFRSAMVLDWVLNGIIV